MATTAPHGPADGGRSHHCRMEFSERLCAFPLTSARVFQSGAAFPHALPSPTISHAEPLLCKHLSTCLG